MRAHPRIDERRRAPDDPAMLALGTAILYAVAMFAALLVALRAAQ